MRNKNKHATLKTNDISRNMIFVTFPRSGHFFNPHDYMISELRKNLFVSDRAHQIILTRTVWYITIFNLPVKSEKIIDLNSMILKFYTIQPNSRNNFPDIIFTPTTFFIVVRPNEIHTYHVLKLLHNFRNLPRKLRKLV